MSAPTRDRHAYGHPSHLPASTSAACTAHPDRYGAPVLDDPRRPDATLVARACSPECRALLDAARDRHTRRLTPARARNAARRARAHAPSRVPR